jgi:hypothetical protein
MNGKVPDRSTGAEPATETERERLKRRFSEMETLVPPRPPLSAIARGPATATTRPGRRMARPLAGAFAALAFVVVLIATGFLISRRSPTPEATRPPAASTAPASPSASRSLEASASPVASPAATVVALKGEFLILTAAWAPDGGHVAVTAVSEDGAPNVTDIFDRSGFKVESIAADEFAWTGANTYRLTRGDVPTDTTHQYLGELGSAKETEVKVGSVAAVSYDALSRCVASHQTFDYTLWIGGRQSASRPGDALACSPDGSEVAVVQITSDTLPYTGWVEVIDAHTGKVIREFRDVQSSDRAWAAFSPDGRALAFYGSAEEVSYGTCIADVSTGTVRQLFGTSGFYVPATPAWLPDGRLAVPNTVTEKVHIFGADGVESSGSLPFAPNLSISSAGVVLAFGDLSRTVGIQSVDGRRSTLDLAAYPMYVVWSLDGLAAVVIGSAGSYDETAVLVVPSE